MRRRKEELRYSVSLSHNRFPCLTWVLDATHIFDGLEGFPTHVVHMRDGTLVEQPQEWPISNQAVSFSSLYTLALTWLKEDRTLREADEKSGKRKKRGARIDEVCLSLLTSCLTSPPT
jgi:hypothetical protein